MRRAAPSDPRAQLRRGSQLNSLPWGSCLDIAGRLRWGAPLILL